MGQPERISALLGLFPSREELIADARVKGLIHLIPICRGQLIQPKGKNILWRFLRGLDVSLGHQSLLWTASSL